MDSFLDAIGPWCFPALIILWVVWYNILPSCQIVEREGGLFEVQAKKFPFPIYGTLGFTGSFHSSLDSAQRSMDFFTRGERKIKRIVK